MKRPSSTKNSSAKMTVTSRRPNPIKVKKTIGTSKITITKTASSGIKHQVILPKTSTVVASSSSSSCSTMSNNSQISSPGPLQTNTSFTTNNDIGTHTSTPSTSTSFPYSTVAINTPSHECISTKKNGVWYLGGNHIVKLLTSVDGDLDHDVLSKLAAVPTVIGELALSVESLVSDDITVGGFENDLLAKIASNTLTAKRGIMAAAAAAAAAAASSSTSSVTSTAAAHNNNAQAAPYANNLPSAPAVAGQVPNPLLANYQPVPNPLAIRITPPASPHLVNTGVTGQQATTEMPMIQAR